MFINSLFLSKLLNLKTDKQSADTVGDGFSYLFSEIIKVKTSEETSSVVQENIGGTLLDHKIIFISNSSLLENKAAQYNNVVKQIEGLYKLFSAPGIKVSEESKKVLNLNNITTDKKQFVTSIISLIQNIFVNTGNPVKEVEVRYVSENMVETKKVNQNNLKQFEEFLSGIIENKPTFSFVIGSNYKQILFDVENLSASNTSDKIIQPISNTSEITANDSVPAKKSTSEVDNKREINTSEDVEFIPENNADNFEVKNTNQSNENSGSQNTKAIKVNVDNYSVSNELKFDYDDKISFSREGNSDKKLFEITRNNATYVSNENSDQIHQIKIHNEKENKQKLNSSAQESVNPKAKVYNESESKIINSAKDFTIDKPEINFQDVGEVKIVIKEKFPDSNGKQVNEGLPTNPKHEFFNNKFLSEEMFLAQRDFKPESMKEFQKITSAYKTETDYSEKDLPKVISLKSDEPKISRAGFPLIADYQDWDIVFEADDNTSIRQNERSGLNNSELRGNYSFNENNVKENKNSDTDTKSTKFTKDSESSNLSAAKTISVNQDVEEAIADVPKGNDNNVLKEDNKVLHLKFSGDKKIITITDANSEKPGVFVKEINDTNRSDITSAENLDIAKVQKEAGTDKKNIEQINPKTKTIKIVEDDLRNNNNNQTNHSNKEEFVIQRPEKSAVDKKEDFSTNLKSEFQNNAKPEIQHEIKTQLLNNKTIIEHFIKSPVVSKTIERFIQIIDAQQAIHKSEIVSYSKQNHSVEIKLAPEELGRIKILIDTNDNNVNAKIEVGNEQTKAIVVNNLPQLKETLSQQGVNLNNVNVSVTSEEQKNSEQTKQKSRKKSQEHHSGVERAEEKKTVRNLGYNTYEYLA